MKALSSDRKIKIAVVGCGRISKNHFGSIARHADDMELAAVCDNDPETLQRHVAECGVPGFTSLEELLRQTPCDLVSICTPSGLHPHMVIQAARAGRHVMTEKPMATRWKDGLEMVKACDDAGVRLFVVKQNRRNATLAVAQTGGG